MQPAQGRRYRILEVLGSGGFGTVYRAEVLTVTGLRREVALKVLNENAASNEDAAKRLRDEARILSNLNHFGIVRVDDLLQWGSSTSTSRRGIFRGDTGFDFKHARVSCPRML